MAQEYLQSSVLPLMLSFDGGTSWKQLVCVTNYTDNMSVGNTETETLNCGTLQGAGSPKFDFAGEAVADYNPGSTLVSRKDLETAMLAGTTIKARLANPGTGSVGWLYYKQGDVLVISVNGKVSPNDLSKFDFSLKGQGTPSIVAP